MHGLIHIILKDLVVSKFGEEKWAAIGAKLGLAESGDGPILEEKQYPDETTVAGIATTAEVLGVSFEDALKVYGAHFVHFVYKGGHLQMLHSMGDSLEEFLKNVNHLHYTLERTYREANFPLFEITEAEDAGDTTASKVTCLSYKSSRGTVLGPLVEGILPELAKVLHNQAVDMKKHEKPEEGYNVSWTLTTSALPVEEGAAATTAGEGEG
eukprot:CAMPEP_0119480030 /NCGR_PEP_ID=MMETSP1344-20130328/9026_1 /TAXON_ID=236787 /ORGANISM="Florenciella parvula, Strain CCMP2471" /LENGTH=210 /DNA_ID=CAMNT_0007514309 /DNA_START=270 /DNA_END=898 /DNA_ORIENTATION=-